MDDYREAGAVAEYIATDIFRLAHGISIFYIVINKYFSLFKLFMFERNDIDKTIA